MIWVMRSLLGKYLPFSEVKAASNWKTLAFLKILLIITKFIATNWGDENTPSLILLEYKETKEFLSIILNPFLLEGKHKTYSKNW